MLDGKLYAIGGYCCGTLRTVERYDPAANAWEAVAPLETAREYHSTVVLDGMLYAVGGYNEDSLGTRYLASVERYDPAVNAWEASAPMKTERAQACACVF